VIDAQYGGQATALNWQPVLFVINTTLSGGSLPMQFVSKRRFAVAITCLVSLAAAALPAHHATAAPARAAMKVGLALDIGGRDDKSFNQLAYQGAVEAQQKYGITFSYVTASSISDQIYYQNLSTYARQKYDLVIGVGFLMAKAMYKAAKAYPNTHFALIDSAPSDAKGNTVNLPNVANIFFREQESGYLVGYMAGLMEAGKVGAATHNTIGAMGGISIPPVNRYIAGYIQGARVADPTIKIKLAYSGDFNDQGKALNIGLSQVAQGADILFQVAGGAGLGFLKAAQKKGVYGIGVDADQGYLGPYMMTSALKKVDKAILLTIGNVQAGKFSGGDNLFSLKNGATGFGAVGSMVPASILAKVNAQAKLIASGKIVPVTVIPTNLS
jgi:basic membrane protein A